MVNEQNDRAGWERIWRSGDIPPRYRSFAEPNSTVVEWADAIPPGGYVLDVGCGVGRHMVYLGGRGFRVAGVDISPSGVQLAREACAARQIECEARVSNMDSLPWPDNMFDAALSTSTIHHHRREGVARALGEVWRVLKPGGLLLVDLPCTDSADYAEMRAQVAAGQLSEIEPNTFIDEQPEIDQMDDMHLPHHFCDEADARDLLAAFELVRLWIDWRDKAAASGARKGKWVASARKPATPS